MKGKIKQSVRYFLYLIMFLSGWYCVTYWRTTVFGISVDSVGGQLYMAAICMFPLSLVFRLVLKLVGDNFRPSRFILQVIVIAVLVIAASEVWASSEEYVFKKNYAESKKTNDVSKSRRWPFTNNHMGYDKKAGFYAGD